MATEADKSYQDDLGRIKKNIKNSYEYFKPNYDRYHRIRKFIFDTSISEDEEVVLDELGKPPLEANELEAYLSRLCGEFAEQEPSIDVTAGDEGEVDVEVIEFVNGHLRYILDEANNNGFSYKTYDNQLSGGFAVAKLWTEYANEISFNQVIKWGLVFDPTLCGFDPLARLPSKTDGRFSFELFPKTKEEAKEMGIDVEDITFLRQGDNSEFNWSYNNSNEDILLIAHYYEYKKKRVKIVRLANNATMTEKRYKKLLKEWEEEGYIAQPPAIVGKPRMTEIKTVCRYTVVENKIIDYIETDFKKIPLVYIDGNSKLIKNNENGSTQEMTRPYPYHAIGIQRLKNFSMQTLGAELENMTMHKWLIAKEAIPPEQEYQDALKDPQKADVVTYNAFKDNNPDYPLPRPEPVQRIPTPPEVTNTFDMATRTIQTILGSHDAALGINNNQLSGEAIVKGATQSNAASKPFLVGYIQGLNELARMTVDLIPLYFIKQRTVPIINNEGKREYKKINQEGGIKINYNANALNVKVRAGVNFEIQKSRDLQMIFQGMGASETFAQFINRKCLATLIKNMRLEGGDILIKQAEEFMQEMEAAQKAQQEAMKNQPNPLQINMQKMELEKQALMQKAQEAEITSQLKAAQLSVEKQQADTDQLKALAAIGQANDQVMIAHDKAQAEETRAAVDLAIKEASMHHKHAKETIELHHKLKGETQHEEA